jgi:hypothetical protein
VRSSRWAAWLRRGTLAAALAALASAPAAGGPLGRLFAPCRGDCAVAVYGGDYLESSLGGILISAPPPTDWDSRNDHIVATAVSRRMWRLWRFDLEPEAGIAQRFGKQDETEVWAAVFFRYRGFPWDDVVLTTAAISTGLNYASGVSEVEDERARDGSGSRLMHYFSPEITLALPDRPDVELLFRIHHRSGVYGLVSDAWGGAQYATVGLRVRF